jgi:hypothetical protein
MKSPSVVSLFGAAVLLGLSAVARAQVAPQPLPPPYAPPPQLQQVPPGEAGAPLAGDLALPTGDEATVPTDPNQQQPVYDPNAAVNYPAANAPADLAAELGPDNDIAQSYDDGYDSQAYAQFQSALAPFGAWDYDGSYGYVWTPASSIVGGAFSPYASCGHWVLSEYGWTWASDWNWGWAPFHYGRWITRAGRWSWVPGTMWGPAWVSWRSGGGYVGWSPLPPRGVRLWAGVGAASPWRFTTAAGLGAARPAFVSSRYLPGMLAHTTVVSNDRLLSHGRWNVHVNAGPIRGVAARPGPLSSLAPGALPRVAVYPRAGLALNARPWVHADAVRTDSLAHGWHAGAPVLQRTEGRAPAFGTGPSARPAIHASTSVWRPSPVYGYGSAGSYGRPSGAGWSAPAARPSYGAPGGYGGAPAYRAPAPAFHAPAPRSYAPAYSPPSGGGSHFGGGSNFGGGSHFGGFSGGHSGGFSGGHSGGFGGGHHR